MDDFGASPVRHFFRRVVLFAVCVTAALMGAERGFAKEALTFQRTSHDFGIANQNAELDGTIGYTNTGSGLVTRIRVLSDCGCYSATASKANVAPGEKGEIKIRFRSLTFSGDLKKKMRVAYHDGQDRVATIELKVAIYGGLILSPGRINFGEVRRGKPATSSVVLATYKGIGKPFEIKDIKLPSTFVAVKKAPYTDEKTKRWQGWRLTFSLEGSPPLGLYRGNVSVRTTHPDTPVVQLPVMANVMGPVWVQSPVVSMGLVRQDRGKATSVAFRPFDRNERFGQVRVKTKSNLLRTSVAANPKKPGTWRVSIQVPRGMKEGPFTDTVVIDTGMRGAPPTEILVSGRVYLPTTARATPK